MAGTAGLCRVAAALICAAVLWAANGLLAQAQGTDELAVLNAPGEPALRSRQICRGCSDCRAIFRPRSRDAWREHTEFATAIRWLACVYRDHARTAEAEPLFKRALAIAESAPGTNHPDVGTRLNNLAGTQGRSFPSALLFRPMPERVACRSTACL